MHDTYEAQDGLVKALLGQTSMAEYATKHMALAAQVLHYSFIRRDTGRSGPWPGLSGEVARPGPDFKISAWPGPDRPADNWRRPGPARISMK